MAKLLAGFRHFARIADLNFINSWNSKMCFCPSKSLFFHYPLSHFASVCLTSFPNCFFTYSYLIHNSTCTAAFSPVCFVPQQNNLINKQCFAVFRCTAFTVLSTLCTSLLGSMKCSYSLLLFMKQFATQRSSSFIFCMDRFSTHHQALLVLSAPLMSPARFSLMQNVHKTQAVPRLETRPCHVTISWFLLSNQPSLFAVSWLHTTAFPFISGCKTTASAINSWVSQCPPRARYYYQTCPHRPHAFILAALQCVDKSTYERLMANNKITTRMTKILSTLREKKKTHTDMKRIVSEHSGRIPECMKSGKGNLSPHFKS